MRRSWGGVFLVIGGLLLVLGMIGALVAKIAGGASDERLQSDEELLTRFRKYRPELEQLVQMFQADKDLGRVGENFTRPDDPHTIGISSQRIQQYRRLCDALGARKCIEGYSSDAPGAPKGKDLIWIHVCGWGTSFGGSEGKGFLYSAAPSFEVVANLDHGLSTQKSTTWFTTWIRHIEGPWYIYLSIAK